MQHQRYIHCKVGLEWFGWLSASQTPHLCMLLIYLFLRIYPRFFGNCRGQRLGPLLTSLTILEAYVLICIDLFCHVFDHWFMIDIAAWLKVDYCLFNLIFNHIDQLVYLVVDSSCFLATRSNSSLRVFKSILSGPNDECMSRRRNPKFSNKCAQIWCEQFELQRHLIQLLMRKEQWNWNRMNMKIVVGRDKRRKYWLSETRITYFFQT